MSRLSPDQKWKRFNEKLEEQMKGNNFYGLGTTYYEMADFLDKEGKDSSVQRKEGYEMKRTFALNVLKNYKDSDVIKAVDILDAGENSCEACKGNRGKRFLLDEAIANPPIPVQECTHKYGCRCTFLPVTIHHM